MQVRLITDQKERQKICCLAIAIAFRSAKNIVTNNRKIHVDRSDKRCHENGMDMVLEVSMLYLYPYRPTA